MEVRLLGSMGEIAARDWDRLVPVDQPFLGHAFLATLETSGSAATETGWQPLHLVLQNGAAPVAAAPLYAKSHSYGEYVFDHGWAEGYRRAGGSYYPKLQVAVPFTPVPGPRLLAADASSRERLIEALLRTTDRLGVSSLHVTFCTESEAETLAAAGLLRRRGIQFHWRNRGYASFDDFLATLRSSKRKMIRRERREVADAGIEIEVLHGPSLTPDALAAFHPFYLGTVDRRWGNAYLSRDFFRLLGERLADRVVLVVARERGRMVGAALNLLSGDTLYGRLWGSLDEFRFLHFEACYYQAIEFAIRHGLARVEAGAQGAHKLQRGYEPVFTWSAHHIRDPGFRSAVARFLAGEDAQLRRHMDELRELTPFHRSEG
ncbi:MAG TPA: GNAT family N-acetyltransferase [Geminicoccaceae bacterium]|nr:GNAT family N-acetyltransferase [Geminicoccaceae bacterium]